MKHDGTRRLTAAFEDGEALVFDSEPLMASRNTAFNLEHYRVAPGSLSAHVLTEHCLMLPQGRRATHFNARLNGKQVRGLIEPNRIQFRAAGDSIATAWNGSVDAIFLTISPQTVAQAMGDGNVASIDLGTDLRPRPHEVLRNLTLALEAYGVSDRRAGTLFEESLLTSIAAQLVQDYGIGGPTSAEVVPLSRRLRARLDDYLRQSLSDDLSVAQIARVVGLSPYHLCRTFRQSTGTSLWQHVLDCRVAEARRLILRGSLSLGQIAHACGFGSYGQFIAAFRKRFGQTPSQFRRSRGD